MKSVLILSIIALLGFTSATEKIATYKTDKARSSIKIEGTSTLHDWEMLAEDLAGTINIDVYRDSIHIKNLSLTVPVNGLKSGNSGMDKNAYKTLKSEGYPQIRYEFITVQNMRPANGNEIHLTTRGKLTVAGKTQVLSIPLTATIKDKGVALQGQTRFKMSSFDLEPPTFMFGSVKTGDEITIQFNINFN